MKYTLLKGASDRWLGLGIAATLAGLAACSDATAPQAAPAAALSAAAGDEFSVSDVTLDEDLERISRGAVPGYAGQVLDASGNLVIFLKNPNANNTRAAERLAAARGRRGAQTRGVKYDFAELRGFQRQVSDRAFGQDVFATDVDEATNKVWFAVADQGARGRVHQLAAQLKVPQDAFVVEVTPRPELRVSLQTPPFPLHGGKQIASSAGTCSAGFNAYHNTHGAVMVTASHCSARQWSLDHGAVYFGSTYSGSVIGNEVQDADKDSCGTFLTDTCVNADATLYRINSGVPFELGRISRTLFYGANQRGSLDINDANPTFQIAHKNVDGLEVGTWVDKVGRTSGWTRGQVTRRCVDLRIEGIRYACQYVSSTWSEKGDSGSPMFVVRADGTVSLHGVLHGGPVGDWTTTWYSPVGRVEKELGGLQVY